MTCTNTIVELNTVRQCWLPQSPTSFSGLCTRCDFYKVEAYLKTIESNLSLLRNPQFQAACCHENQIRNLICALTTLCQAKNPEFPNFFAAVQTSSLQKTLLHQIHVHSPSSRCCLYQHALKHRTLQRELCSTDIPKNCWTCLSWMLRQRDLHRWYPTFNRAFVSNQLTTLRASREELLDCMISLTLAKKDHMARLLFHKYEREIQNQEEIKQCMIQFLSQPATISSVFGAKVSEFIPTAWNRKQFQERLQKETLRAVRARNWVFKEELMIKTWHPDRLFAWCFDIEDLKDFELATL